MIEEATQQAESRAPAVTPRRTPMAMCPMATMCKGMMEKPPSGFFAMLAGAVLIVLGMLIVVEPTILVWLVGIAFVLFGVALLVMANFLRRLGVQLRNT
jgi:Flp pilus assembly protein TadB